MTKYIHVETNKLSNVDRHQYMISLVSPRPIAWVSTQDAQGNVNLAPYSYFTAISSSPAKVAFSVNIDANGKPKDTLANIEQTKECVINMVSYDMVKPMAFSGLQFGRGINEFDKAGLQPMSSKLVSPPRIADSVAQMECTLDRIIKFGNEPGASNLIICDVKLIHCRKDDYIRPHRLNPSKLDLVARMGRTYYSRTAADALFSNHIKADIDVLGYDNIHESIKQSPLLKANDIYEFAKLKPSQIPTSAPVDNFEIMTKKVRQLRNEKRFSELYALLLAYYAAAQW